MRTIAALPFYLAGIWILLLALIAGGTTINTAWIAHTEGFAFAAGNAIIGMIITIALLLAGGGVWWLARRIQGPKITENAGVAMARSAWTFITKEETTP